MKKLALCVAAGAVLVGALPAMAAMGTSTEVLSHSVGYVKAYGSDAAFGGPGVAKLKKDGKVLKTDSFQFQKAPLDGKGGVGYFKDLYADKDGTCILLVKFKGTDKYAPSKDTKAFKCREEKE